MIRICRDCQEEFDTADSYNKHGYVDQCGDCADEVPRYVGRSNAAAKAGAGLEIFRSECSINVAKAVCNSECRAGFNANLGLGSTTSTFGKKADI